MMADLRGFTRMVERLAPADAVALLDEGLTLLARPVLAAEGTVDKYIGDGVLAFFEGAGHAETALATAQRILAAIDADNAAHPDRIPWRVGVALHSGRAMIGTIGPAERREYTIVGDVVNVVARLEEVAKQHELRLVASTQTVRLAPRGGKAFSGPELQPLRGRAAPLEVFDLPNTEAHPWD